MSGAHFTIELPIPDRKLWPNGRAHHMVRARLTKRHRNAAAIQARAIGIAETLEEPVRVAFRYRFATNRHRDREALVAAPKPYIDGLEDAGVFDNDRRIVAHDVDVEVDGSRPERLVIEVHRATCA